MKAQAFKPLQEQSQSQYTNVFQSNASNVGEPPKKRELSQKVPQKSSLPSDLEATANAGGNENIQPGALQQAIHASESFANSL